LCLNDPDGNLVEFYIVDEDLEHSAPKKEPAKPAAPTVTRAWEHLLGSPFPEKIPAESESQDEVRLRGTFNLKRGPEEVEAILSEARRVLKPRGELMIHLLVSDKPVTKKLPRLPGPAALVEHTPTEAEVIRSLEEAGFQAIL